MSAAHRAGAATYTPIPGTRVQLIAPPSFVIARTFTGLQWQEAGASVVVAELPGPASEMQTGMTAEQLAKRGMALRGSDNVDAELGPAVLLEVSQNVQGVEFSKWLLIAGDASTTVMLTATSPSVVANKLGPVLRSTVLSARWTAGADVDPAAGLDIRVVETDDLRLAPTMAGTLILTNGGVSGPLGPADPLLVISRSTPPEAIADLAMFSKNRLAQTSTITAVKLRAEKSVRIAGMPGHEIIASAMSPEGIPVSIYQAVAFDGHDYFVVIGFVGPAQSGRYLPQFRGIAHGLTVVN